MAMGLPNPGLEVRSCLFLLISPRRLWKWVLKSSLAIWMKSDVCLVILVSLLGRALSWYLLAMAWL